MKYAFTLGLLALTACAVVAQDPAVRYCGQTEMTEKLFQRHPALRADAAAAHAALDAFASEMSRGGGDQVYIIPVVFHVIHNNGPENISDAQILNGLEILNRDFRKLNEDIEDVVPAFEAITADIEIEFRLAGLDPDGECTSGITRTVSSLTYDGDDDVKDLIQWPRNRYMNVWICAEAAGAAGYTYMPPDVNGWGGAGNDGIVIKSDYVGAIGTSTVGKSRVLTHEVGHWLNLFHCWGQSNNPGVAANCDQDDNVTDTPDNIGWTSCNLNGASCGNEIDNVQNYMEYSYCSRMFTLGQRTRMRAAAQSNVAQRNQLWTSANLISTGTASPVLCAAVFSSNRSSVCQGEPISFFDNSYHGVTEWHWNFGDGTQVSGNDPAVHKNPVHTYAAPGEYTVTLTVGNGDDELTSSVVNYVSILTPGTSDAPFSEGFETAFPANNWSVFNQNNDQTWAVSGSASYGGTNALKLNNHANTLNDNRDELISTTYNMSMMQEVYLTYKWAYANKINETDDRLRISVTGDCGANWFLKKVHKGLTDLPTVSPTNFTFTPTSLSQWAGNDLTFDDADWFTDRFRFKFEFLGKGGNNIYLDDINISGLDTLGNIWSNIQPVTSIGNVQVFPNPASADMNLWLDLPSAAALDIALYNSVGQRVLQLADGRLAPGNHRMTIPRMSRGLYTLVLVGDETTIARKLVFE